MSSDEIGPAVWSRRRLLAAGTGLGALVVVGGPARGSFGDIARDTASSTAAVPRGLEVFTAGYPRASSFRQTEAPRDATFEAWERRFRVLNGIEGKTLAEEIPIDEAKIQDYFRRFKEQHPNKLVLLHFNGKARHHSFHIDRYFPGHWLYYAGTTTTARLPESPNETTVKVANSGVFKPNRLHLDDNAPPEDKPDDIVIAPPGPDGQPNFRRAEYLKLVRIPDPHTIVVRRGELIDVDNNRKPDRGFLGPGKDDNVYGKGVVALGAELRKALPGKLILADGMLPESHQRNFDTFNWMESEGFPTLRDPLFGDWGGALNQHRFWATRGASPQFNYTVHKYIDKKEFTPTQNAKAYALARLAMAAAVFTDSTFCVGKQTGPHPVPDRTPGSEEKLLVFDELWRGVDQQPNWLGQPIRPARHLAKDQPDLFGGAAVRWDPDFVGCSKELTKNASEKAAGDCAGRGAIDVAGLRARARHRGHRDRCLHYGAPRSSARTGDGCSDGTTSCAATNAAADTLAIAYSPGSRSRK
ncbi:MAG: hypothetical protein ACRDT0_12620 [Pseudonocardiaceae bacterium]